MLNKPSYKVALTSELAFERHAKNDVAYFSPLSATTLTVGVQNDWTMFRRYSRRYAHGLGAQVGMYDQSGHSAAGIWSLDYEFRVDLSDRWGGYAGVSLRSNVYDGSREGSLFFLAGIRGQL